MMDADDFRRIRYIAKSYAKKCERITEDDLFQIGVMAYIEGIDKWDPLKGKKWDYMWLVVGGKIAGYARDRESLIYISHKTHTSMCRMSSRILMIMISWARIGGWWKWRM